MKIGITCYPTYGGSGVVATELGLELAQRGHEIHFISYAQPIRLRGSEPNIRYHEVEVSRYPLFDYPPYDLALATRMAEVAQLYDLDLLHVHYAIPHSVSAFLARQMLVGPRGRRLPFVTTLHGTDITLVGLDRSYLPITRYSIEQSDGVTAISNYLRDRTLRVFDVKNRIEVIYNSVNCDVYRRDPEAIAPLRAEYAPNNERLLVHLSNFRPVKRLTDVIEIFDRVHKKIPSRLLLIGDGPDRSVADWLAVQKSFTKMSSSSESRTKSRRRWSRRRHTAAEPTRIVRTGGARSHGLRGRAHSHPGRRSSGSDRAREERLSRRCGRCRHDGALCARVAQQRAELRQIGKQARAAAQERFCSTKIVKQYEDFYLRVLERSA